MVIVNAPFGVFGTPCCPLPVDRVRLELADPLAGDTEAGEKAQLAPAGSPVQLRLIAPGKAPPRAVALTVYAAGEPALTVALPGEAASE